ncbi:hypothetical protein GF312_20255 [Candidatus Poribacteria bacterium]|nr:hypothetical protein [Candidatus Poribacteria bacterium]
MKLSGVEIPKKTAIVIIIIFVGVGIQGVIYAFRYFNGNDPSEPEINKNISKNTTTSKFISITGVTTYRDMEEYQVVTDQDLLMPLGWEKSQPKPEPEKEPKTFIREITREEPKPNKSLILTGITKLDGELMVLMEDLSDNKAYYLKQGDGLKNYMVDEITQDKVILTNGKSEIIAHLGSRTTYNSDGVLLASASSYEFEPSSAKTESETSVDDDTKLSIIERMKARRRKELGKE